MELGISRDKATFLMTTYLHINIKKQLIWLPYRKDIKNPIGAFIRALEENWTEPVDYPKKSSTQIMLEKMRERSKALLRIAKEDVKKGVSKEKIKEWEDKLEVREDREKLRACVKPRWWMYPEEEKELSEEEIEKKKREVVDKIKSLKHEELNYDPKTKRDIPDKT